MVRGEKKNNRNTRLITHIIVVWRREITRGKKKTELHNTEKISFNAIFSIYSDACTSTKVYTHFTDIDALFVHQPQRSGLQLAFSKWEKEDKKHFEDQRKTTQQIRMIVRKIQTSIMIYNLSIADICQRLGHFLLKTVQFVDSQTVQILTHSLPVKPNPSEISLRRQKNIYIFEEKNAPCQFCSSKFN